MKIYGHEINYEEKVGEKLLKFLSDSFLSMQLLNPLSQDLKEPY